MKTFNDIQNEINQDFEEYLSNLLQVDNLPRKYFYWTIDFFKTVDNLSFQYFSLTGEQKDKINEIGKSYFDSSDIYFEINKNSHRHDLLIKNINKIFKEKVFNQTKRYEYLKEFIFWQILVTFVEEISKELATLKKEYSSDLHEINNLELELNHIEYVAKKQKSNYLVTYITFLIHNTNNPTFNAFRDYIKYNLTNKGEELIKQLDELDREYIYDSKTGKEIRNITRNLNPELREKINNLYVLKKEEDRLYFVFSKNGGGEKEELRELLEIMGNKDTGKLYRGQANSFWNLDASITREPKYLEHEADMYYDILSLKPDAFKDDATVYERLITMQHYGMPTRLLDITRNPLVAIFFACNNLYRKDSDGIIFTFKPQKEKFLNFEKEELDYISILFNDNKKITNKEEEKKATKFLFDIWFIKGVAKNQRINNQSGDFIFVGKGDDLKEKLNELPKALIIIDAKTKKVLIEQLESLNIHGGAVYPDLTHMSNYIRNKYLNENKPVTPTIKSNASVKVTPKKLKVKAKKQTQQSFTIPEFDFTKIKEKDKNAQLIAFSKFHNLDKAKVEKLIDNILFTEKPPLPNEVVDALKEKPNLKNRLSIIKALTAELITLSKIISEK